MKRIITLLTLAVAVVLQCFASEAPATRGKANKAKYVFYLILDGTSFEMLHGAEIFHSQVEGKEMKLFMGSLPVQSFCETQTADDGITDSAAAGTALSSSQKTNVGILGMLPDKKTPTTTIADWAKAAGVRVAIGSNTSINHATPAAFYAHVPNRRDYYLIGEDVPKSAACFMAGSSLRRALDPIKYPKGENLYEIAQKAGYTIAYGMEDYELKRNAEKLILVQKEVHPVSGEDYLPYIIDKRPQDMDIRQVFKAQIDFLSKDLSKGFLCVTEIGGRIDHAGHANDVATCFPEVWAADDCVKMAYDFYMKHPDETLIVVVADHDCGSLSLGDGKNNYLNLKTLTHQKCSSEAFTHKLKDLRQIRKYHTTWADAKALLRENFGFWNRIELTPDDELRLKDVFELTFLSENSYQNSYEYEPLAEVATKIMMSKAHVVWGIQKHTQAWVPLMSCGVGSDVFRQIKDNTQIPLLISEIAGYKVPENLKHK